VITSLRRTFLKNMNNAAHPSIFQTDVSPGSLLYHGYAAKSCGICGNEDLEEPIHDQYLAYCNECGRDVNQLYVP